MNWKALFKRWQNENRKTTAQPKNKRYTKIYTQAKKSNYGGSEK